MALKIPTIEILTEKIPEASELSRPIPGGQKIVFRAKIGGHQEALKLFQLPPLEAAQEEKEALRKEVTARIHREIDLLGKCKSPFIVKLGRLKPRPLIADEQEYVIYSEEFLEGENLWNILRAGQSKPNEAELKILLTCLLKAIKELWSLKIVHRDIKPPNVVKTKDLHRPFVLLDLGIAFSIIDTPLTINPAARFPPATYRYIAPEMLDPDFRKNIDFRADLYAVGLTVFEYAAQKHPLADDFEDQLITMSRARSQPPPSLHDYRSDISEEFCALIDQMLKKTPALRPSNLDSMIKKMEGESE